MIQFERSLIFLQMGPKVVHVLHMQAFSCSTIVLRKQAQAKYTDHPSTDDAGQNRFTNLTRVQFKRGT